MAVRQNPRYNEQIIYFLQINMIVNKINQIIRNMINIGDILNQYWHTLVEDPNHFQNGTILTEEMRSVDYALQLVEQYLGLSDGIIQLENGDPLPNDQILDLLQATMVEIGGFNDIELLNDAIYAN